MGCKWVARGGMIKTHFWIISCDDIFVVVIIIIIIIKYMSQIGRNS